MTRMDRRRVIETRQKYNRVKWLLALAFIGSTILFYFYGPGFIGRIINQREVPEPYNLVYKGQPEQISVVIRQGIPFIPVSWIREHLVPDLEVLTQSGKARWTPEEGSVHFMNPRVTESVASVSFPIEVSLLEDGDDLYFPLHNMEPLLGVSASWHPDTKILVVDDVRQPAQRGTLLEDASLRVGHGRYDVKITTLEKDTEIRILETYENHYRVLSEKGLMGFLSQSSVGGLRRVEKDPMISRFGPASPEMMERPFGLVWDYVGGTHPDRSDDEVIGVLSVFSPTWFELKDEQGHIDNRAQFRYTHHMKHSGYQLWGLVTNAFDPDLTEAFMGNEVSRRRFINQLLVYAAMYQLDGINIDFENIHFRNQDLFTDFVQELSESLRQQDLIVSIDVTIPGGSLNWSQVYDRRALEPHVDYFAVMTYDEHWGSSPTAGSVASIGWVERGIEATLEEVPPEKILIGLPLYTRLWEEKPQNGGGVSVSSRAMGMQFIRRTLEDHGVTENEWEWLEEIGQYYAEYEAEGNRYRVWLEDERSIALKADLIEKYQLAGFAAWRKDFELPEIWEVLNEKLRTMK